MEEWFVKENGGTSVFVGIASTRSRWFIAENMLRKNPELVCRLFNTRKEEKTMGCKCELKNCTLLGNGVCCSTNTVPCESVPEQFLDYSMAAHNSDYEKSCETCVYGVDGCQHEPPCITGAGKPHYEKLNFA